MLKVTFTLDDATIARLERTARRLGVAKSAVVREAVLEYEARADQLVDSEQARLLAAVDRMARRAPTRTQEQLDEELASLRAARRGAGAAGEA
jgi:predicted transcriptional regulator